MTTLGASPALQALEHLDQRIVLRGTSWADYERILVIRGEAPAPRLTYLEGNLELMSPSWDHEWIRTCIGRLVEAYADELGIDLNGVGSWTVRAELRQRGLEPDECYVLGPRAGKLRPDLAIEVPWTPGGLDKLEVYRGLEVPEVWIWSAGGITVHLLRGGGYERGEASALLPGLDIEALARHIAGDSQAEAVRAFRAWLRGPR